MPQAERVHAESLREGVLAILGHLRTLFFVFQTNPALDLCYFGL